MLTDAVPEGSTEKKAQGWKNTRPNTTLAVLYPLHNWSCPHNYLSLGQVNGRLPSHESVSHFFCTFVN